MSGARTYRDRTGRTVVLGTILAAAAWIAWASPASGEPPVEAPVQLDPDGAEPGSIDVAQTCSDVRDAILGFVAGASPGTPIPLAIPNLDLGPVGIGTPARPATITLDCGATNSIEIDGVLVLSGKHLGLDLRLVWDGSTDLLPDVTFDVDLSAPGDGDPTTPDDDVVLAVSDVVGLVGELFPSAAVDSTTLGDFALKKATIHFAAVDGALEFDLLADTRFTPGDPAGDGTPATDQVDAGYLLSVTDPPGDGTDEGPVVLNALRFVNADGSQDTFTLAGLLRGDIGSLVADVELPNMWMAMVQPSGAELAYGDLRPVPKSFFPTDDAAIPTTFRFDADLSVGANVFLDALGPDLQRVFGWEDGAVASLRGELGFDFGTFTDLSTAIDLHSVAIEVDLPDLAPGPDSPFPDWLALQDAGLRVGWEDGTGTDGAAELQAGATVQATIPDDTQPGGEVTVPLEVEATIGTELLGGVRQTSLLFSAAPPDTTTTLWPAPYGLDWLDIGSIGTEVLIQFTDDGDEDPDNDEPPIVDGAITAEFDIGGKTFALRLSLAAVGTDDLAVEILLELRDTISLADVLGVFGDFSDDLPAEFDLLTIGGNPDDPSNPKPPLRVTARLLVGEAGTSVAVAVNAPGTIPIAGSPFDVDLLFSIEFPAGGDPVLIAGARTGAPVTVSELLGGVLGPDFTDALETGDLSPFNFSFPAVGLVVNTSEIRESSASLTAEEHEFFRALFGCGGFPAPEGCTFDVKLPSGVHLLTGVPMPTDADGFPVAADVLKALWVWDGPTKEEVEEDEEETIPPPPQVQFRASVLLGDGERPSLAFNGVELSLSLPIKPGEDVRPDWFNAADLSISLGLGPSGVEFELAGALTVQLRDETVAPADTTTNPDCIRSWIPVSRLPGSTEHACYDVLTFRVLSQISLSSSGASVLIGGDLLTEPGVGWPEPLGIPFLRVDAAKLRLGVTFAPAGPQFEIGLLAAGALFDKDFSGSILFGLKPLPNPPFVVPTFGGLRLSSQAGLEVADVIDLYDAMRGFAEGFVQAAESAGDAADLDPALLALLDLPDLTVDLSAIPNVALRNLELMVGIGSSTDLCIEPGLKIGAELYLNATPLDSAPQAPPGGCNSGPVAVDPTECLANEECFAAVAVNATLDGLIISGSMGEFTLGPFTWEDALFDLRFTPTQQKMQIKGGSSIEGISEGTVDVTIGSDGVAFLGDVVLFPGLVDDQGDPVTAFRALIEGELGLDMKAPENTEAGALAELDFELHAVLQADFAAATAAVLDPILSALRTDVLLLDAVVNQLLNSGDPLEVVLDLPDTLRALDQPVPAWVDDLVDRIRDALAEAERFGLAVPTLDSLLTTTVPLPGLPGQFIPAERTCYWVDPLTGTTTIVPGTVVDETCWSDVPDPERLYWYPAGRAGKWVNPVCWAIEGVAIGEVADGSCYRIAPDALPSLCEVVVADLLPEGVTCDYANVRDLLFFPALHGALEGLGLPPDTSLPDLLAVLADKLGGALPPIRLECVDFRLDTAGGSDGSGINLRMDTAFFGQDLDLRVAWSFREPVGRAALRLSLDLIDQLFLDPPTVRCLPIGSTTTAGGAGDGTTSPALPDQVRLDLDDTVVRAGEDTTLKAAVSDNVAGTTPVQVKWGDGDETDHTVAQLRSGIPHTYPDDHPETGTPSDVLTIEVEIPELDIVEQIPVTVYNTPPADLTLDPVGPVDEGEPFTLSGTFVDTDTDTHSVAIDWGDGTTTTVDLAVGARSFSAPHTYADDVPSNTPSDTRRVGVVVTDDDTGTTSASAQVVVENVAPSAIAITPAQDVLEGDTADFTVTFTDPGVDDTHLITIDWGDGSRPTNLPAVDGERSIDVTHRFLDDDPSGTAADNVGVVVTVVDDDTGQATTTSPVTVHNVDPTVTLTLDVTQMEENRSVEATVTLTDPGPRDTHTVTIDWGTATFADTVAVLTPGQRTFVASKQYGDDGVFAVAATVTDDDTGQGDDGVTLTVDNVDPTIGLDETETVSVAGGQTFFTREGVAITLPVDVTDPGSDDLTLTWDWDDETHDTTTSLVNDPVTEPEQPSPTVQPRSIVSSAAHAWTSACLYAPTATADDDDGGSASDSTWVVVTGITDDRRVTGWWARQYETGRRNRNDLEADRLDCYLDIVEHVSAVFGEVNPIDTWQKVRTILDPKLASDASDPYYTFDRQLLAAWLNMAHGSVGWDEAIDTDGDGVDDTPFLEFVQTAEAMRLDPNTTREELLAMKDILEQINTGAA